MSDLSHSVTPLRAPQTSTAAPPHAEDSERQLAILIAQAADERKAGDIKVLKVTDVSYLTDYFVIVTGFSAAQVRAISRSIEDTVATTLHRNPLRTQGRVEGTWVVHDYGEVIAHIFMPDEREFYGLEAFWGHAEAIEWN